MAGQLELKQQGAGKAEPKKNPTEIPEKDCSFLPPYLTKFLRTRRNQIK